jgi:hypothetical protein
MAKNWVEQAQGSYLEDLSRFRESLGDEYSASRRSLVSSLYGLGLRGGGVTKGMGELGRTYGQNIAMLGKKESDVLQQGQEAQRALGVQSEIDSLTRAYQDALENATKMRRGAEQQMFDTGAGNEAGRLEAEAKRLRGQIQGKYGELSRMSMINPYIGELVQQAPGLFGQFDQAARQGESQISSGRTIWGDISQAVLPVMAGMFLPGIGQALGLGGLQAGAGELLSKIPGVKAVSDLMGKIPSIPGMEGVPLEDIATNFLTKRKPEEYLMGKIAESKQKKDIEALIAKGYRQTVTVDKEGNKSYQFVAPEYPIGGKPEKVDYAQAVKQYDIQPLEKDLTGKGYAKADIAGLGMRWVKPLNPQNLPQVDAMDMKNYDISNIKKPGYEPVVLAGKKSEDGSLKMVFAKPKLTVGEKNTLDRASDQSSANSQRLKIHKTTQLDAFVADHPETTSDEAFLDTLGIVGNDDVQVYVRNSIRNLLKSKRGGGFGG